MVFFTWLLVIAGSLVTSNDAAQSVPDWPLSYGKLVPPLEGGIRFEFAHRVLAAVVGLLVLTLALQLRTTLGWLAAGAVFAQVLLGGAVVKLLAPRIVPIIHASLAQLVFGIVVAILVKLLSDSKSLNNAGIIATAALFLQTVLGAAARHNVMSIVPHMVGAGVATLAVMVVCLRALMNQMDDAPIRRSAIAMLGFTFFQIFLGMGSYIARIANANEPQPMPLMVGFTVAHVAVGSLAFGSAVAFGTVA